MNDSPTVINVPQKSMVIALLLTFFLGPLGMLYSTILGAIIMFFVFGGVAVVTFGLGLVVPWVIALVWTAIAVNSYNKKAMALVGRG